MKIIGQTGNRNDRDAVGECDDCGKEVRLYREGLVNTCECGANYNLFGQRLKDNPDYWSDTQPAEL